ncbi:HET-domain-containing protein [Aspergillus welwitschiae]|uniref:HET-domain-containing protein n=1 Tax=Aspergillus welwitschiae TaxID=1341132 RepID=A0A3F3QJI9_9EURO|nr:HET-domain-containing protein [Aspergillus welwitschiae]RDH39438.1 HET-domain-containing protein [Aspergillus welwitschiae]
MSPGRELVSDRTWSAFTYAKLPDEPSSYTTRMIRLLPSEDPNARLECEIIDYDLAVDTGSGDLHLYEALSYVWGSDKRSRKITLNGCVFSVTENLYVALLHLRNRQLERLLWVDAICIDQDNWDEKAKQIPLMRTIYAQAQDVIVWLGEAYEDGDKALNWIRCIDEEKDISIGEYQEACLKLLQRAWFRRIWVLQEVGVAQFIYVMCGSVQIKGHVFCEGLRKSGLSSRFQALVGPVAFLIRSALDRPKYEPNSRGSLTIGELLGMYCSHDATEQHDKVYALLGLSADPITDALTPNLWPSLGYECSVETWHGIDTAVIKGKAWIIGHLYSVHWNHTAQWLGNRRDWKTEWQLQASARLVQDGDILCLLQGASKPSIIRLCRDHFTIVMPAVTPRKRRHGEMLEQTVHGRRFMNSLIDILLTWRVPLADHYKVDLDAESKLNYMAPDYKEEQSEVDKRRNLIMWVIVDTALDALAMANLGKKTLEHLLCQSGTTRIFARSLTAAAPKDSASWFFQSFFHNWEGDFSSTDDIVEAVAEDDGSCGYILMELLLQHQGEDLTITKAVPMAAAKNIGKYAHKITEVLFQHRENDFPVTKEVVEAAAGNTSQYGHIITRILFQQRKENILFSEEVVKAAAANARHQTMELLIQYRGGGLPISEEVVKTAAENTELSGSMILEFLFMCKRDILLVSEEVVKTAARNPANGLRFMEILFKRRGENLPVTEEVIKAAAENETCGTEILSVLFRHRRGSLPISKNVVITAAKNTESFVRCLLRHRGKRLPVSEEAVKTAAANTKAGDAIIDCFLELFEKNLPVSEGAVRAAAANTELGDVIMKSLFRHRGRMLPVSDGVVQTASRNDGCGIQIMNIIRAHLPSVPIREE